MKRLLASLLCSAVSFGAVAAGNINTGKALAEKYSCATCHGKGGLRPHVVWFGEIPLYMPQINRALESCSLFIAIGTSGMNITELMSARDVAGTSLAHAATWFVSTDGTSGAAGTQAAHRFRQCLVR